MVFSIILLLRTTHKEDNLLNNDMFYIMQIFEYTRLVEILLHIVTNDEDDFIQRLGWYKLLVCYIC